MTAAGRPFTPRFTDLVTMLRTAIEKHGARPLLGVKQGGAWAWTTYADFGALVDRFRAGLASLGVARGDRVAVIANNRLEWAVGCYAAYGLGAAYVPMYENQLDKDWHYILSDCGARVCLVANARTHDRVSRIAREIPTLARIVSFEGGADDPTSWAALLELGARQPVPAITPDGKEVCGFVYTSGTTGNPKGVRLTHANLTCNVLAVLEIVPFDANDRSLSFLPWAHVFGGSTELHGIVALGASLAICTSVDKLVEELAEVKPTVLFAVPRIWNRIYDGVQKSVAGKPRIIRAIFRLGMSARSKLKTGGAPTLLERIALPIAEKLIFGKIRARFGGRLRYAVSGAAALTRDVAEFIDNLGITVFEGYGMTESSSVATANAPGARRIGTVGRPIPGVSIEIDHAAPGGDAENGEIVIHGHNVMAGYHNLPEETAKVLTPDGGLRSGDLGRLDPDGFLTITGRVKELYKLENGKYVAPAPLEEKIALSPYIAQVMVHGADKPYNVAVVVPDLATLQGWAAGHGVNEADLARILADDRTRALISEEIEKHSEEFKAYEKVKKFILVGEEFSTQNDMLTPTLKVKRRNVLKKYERELNSLY